MGIFDWFNPKPKTKAKSRQLARAQQLAQRVGSRSKSAGVFTLKNPRERNYEAADVNRLNQNFQPGSTSEDSETYRSLRQIRNRARALCRDNPYADGAVEAIVDNVVGRGIGFQSQVKLKSGEKLANPINEQIEKEFWRWWKKKYCDLCGGLSFVQMQRLIMSSCVQSGEVLVRMHYKKMRGSRVALALEILESDYLADQYNQRATDTQNEVRMGIELDKDGAPLAYWLYAKHPGDYLLGFLQSYILPVFGLNRVGLVRVPADEILHIYRPEKRPHQRRGISWLTSALNTLKDVADYEIAELIRAEAAASQVGFIETPNQPETFADTDPATGKPETDENGDRLVTFEAGQMNVLAPGEKITLSEPAQVGNGADAFLRHMLRKASRGLKIAYETLTGDYSQSNFSASRLGILSERLHYEVLQDWFIDVFLQPVYEKWLFMAITSGALKLDGYFADSDRYTDAVQWLPRKWPYIDPVKDLTAKKEAIRAGLSTRSRELADVGLTPQEVDQQQARDLESQRQYKLKYDTNLEDAPPSGASGSMSAAAAQAQDNNQSNQSGDQGNGSTGNGN